jgi:hypothetical protein
MAAIEDHSQELSGLDDLYRTVPLQNAGARQIPIGEDLVLDVPINRKRMRYAWLAWFVPLRSHRRIHLDTLGAQIFRLCDGHRPVEGIIDEFAGCHRLTFHESRTAVVTYLRSLIQRGAIAVAVPPVPVGAS